MNYKLDSFIGSPKKHKKTIYSLRSLIAHMVNEKKTLFMAFVAMIFAALLTLIGPLIIGYTIDHYVETKQYHGVLIFCGLLLIMYILNLGAGYTQTKIMGSVGQRMLFTLRNSIFEKIQELPLAFFNQNKAGDLISRVNSDTEKINQFFSQSLMQFVRSILVMIGAAVFLLSINIKLGAASLIPAVVIWLFTILISPWVKKHNGLSLKKNGELSAQIQENLANFKVVVAFNRRDYFRDHFNSINKQNYEAAVKAGIANHLFMPVYSFLSNIGQLIVLTFGIFLIARGQFTIGLLISYIAYVTNFYNPLRQLANLWANFQLALAAWDRVLHILNMENDMTIKEVSGKLDSEYLLSFQNVSFLYPDGNEVLHDINFDLERGKTYAFVGPTGGGKTTTASLISRLYDPSKGMVLLDGCDIRSCKHEDRVKKIGFILQEPFLFSGTVKDNILYGNNELKDCTNSELTKLLNESGLDKLIDQFDDGLETSFDTNQDGISLGQKQLVAFMRAVLRKPDLLILDEATANIDTITETLLDEILDKLPQSTTKVIIAHRLNTIAGADQIYFVNSGNVIPAGSLDEAVKMLMDGRMVS